MTKYLLGLLLINVGLAFAQPGATQNQTALIRSSQFIFEGTVEKLHASNVKLLAASDQTAVVRVDTMLRAPRGMSFAGRAVTLYLKDASRLKPGQHAVFFANGWLYGENMAMRAVGQLTPAAAEGLKNNIGQVDAQTADEALLVRLRSADLVIVGKVGETRVSRQEKVHRSEHETDWSLAEDQVITVLKGQPARASGVVPVFFPTSTDELWYLSPKFSTGQEGIFILSSREAKQYGLEGYTALSPLDFQPLKDRERVERLIRGLR